MRAVRLAFATCLASLLAPAVAQAAVIDIDPTGDLIAAVNSLQSGDELVLAGGPYNLTSLFVIGVSGTAQAPIVIRAKEGEVPATSMISMTNQCRMIRRCWLFH